MLDLETMSCTANAAIVAIGACEFDLDLGVTREFYQVVDLQSCISKKFDVDGRTVKWWLQQSEPARNAICAKGVDILDALKEFQGFLGKNPQNYRIWGNGSDFDNTILINAFQRHKVMAPWKYANNRCFRTIKASFPQIKMPESDGVHHHALDDAKWQANYLVALVEKYKLDGVLS